MNSGNGNFAVVLKGLLSTSLALAVFLAPFAKPVWAQRQTPQVDTNKARVDTNISAEEIERIPSRDIRPLLIAINTHAQSIGAAASSSAQPAEDRLNQITGLSELLDREATSLNGSAGTMKMRAIDIYNRAREINGWEEAGNSARAIEESASSIQSSSATIATQAKAINSFASDRQSSPRFSEIMAANRIILDALTVLRALELLIEERSRRMKEFLERAARENRGELRPGNRSPQTNTSRADDYNKFEFFAGYSHNRVDAGDEREGFNGFATSVTGNFSRYVGIKGYYSFHTKSFEEDGFDFSSGASIHQLLGGVHFQDNALDDGPVRPFAHIMAGVAHHRFSFDDGPGSFSDSRTGLAGVGGGGIDFRLNDRADFRIQFDYNPNRIDGDWQHNVRAGFGVVFKFGK